MKRTTQGDLFAVACGCCGGMSIIPAKMIVAVISSETLTFYLFLFAFGFSLLPLLFKSQRRIVFSVTRDQITLLLQLAVLFSVAIFFSWKALEFLEPATQSFLSRIKVLLLVIMATIILKEKLHPLEIIGGVVALSGVVLLKFQAGLDVSRGATLMLLSAMLFSVAEIMLKRKITTIHPTLFLFYRNLSMIPCFAAIVWLRGKSFALPDLRIALLIALTALLAPIGARTLYILAIRRNSLSRTVLINQMQPLFAGLGGYLLLNSVPTSVEWLGGGLILIGAFIIRTAFKNGPAGNN